MTSFSAPSELAWRDQKALVDRLQQAVRQLETARRPAGLPVLSCGTEALDALLPERGLGRGTLVEWLASVPGSGAGSLALGVAAEVQRQLEGAVVVVDPYGQFYAPAAAGWGLSLAELVIVRPAHWDHALWAIDQALRCPGVAAVWAGLPAVSQRALRRLQLAAEAGGGVGLLVRPAEVRRSPSWAEVRWWVEPRPSRGLGAQPPPADRREVQVRLLSGRGVKAGGAVCLELAWEAGRYRFQATGSTAHETRPLHLASQLAPGTAVHRAARA